MQREPTDNPDGSCRGCGAKVDEQHRKTCPVWLAQIRESRNAEAYGFPELTKGPELWTFRDRLMVAASYLEEAARYVQRTSPAADSDMHTLPVSRWRWSSNELTQLAEEAQRLEKCEWRHPDVEALAQELYAKFREGATLTCYPRWQEAGESAQEHYRRVARNLLRDGWHK